MAVEALYYSSHDGFQKAIQNPDKLMFADRKSADLRDKELDLAMYLGKFLARKVDSGEVSLSEQQWEEIALVIAENREKIAPTLKFRDMESLVEDAE